MEGRGVKRDQRMAAYWFEKLGSLKATLQDGTLDPGMLACQTLKSFNYQLMSYQTWLALNLTTDFAYLMVWARSKTKEKASNG